MKTKSAIAFALLAISLASCHGGSVDPLSPVSGNEFSAKDLGVPFVELTAVNDADALSEMRAKLSESLSSISGASKKSYSYLYDSAYSEIESQSEIVASFYGTDKQYATLNSETIDRAKLGGAYTIKGTSSSQVEYVLSKDHFTLFSKNVETISSGKKTTTYSSSFQPGDYEPTPYTSIQAYLNNTFISNDVSCAFGTDSNGRLYGVNYAERYSNIASFDEDGQSVTGISRHYTQYLVDMNTLENPKYISVSYAMVSESNVDKNNIRSDAFHVTGKASFVSSFSYDPIKDNEPARNAFLDEYPSLSIVGLNVYSNRQGYSHGLLDLSRVEGSDDSYIASMTMDAYAEYSFRYAGRWDTFDREKELVTKPSVLGVIGLSDAKIIDAGQDASRVTLINDTTIVSSEKVTLSITFKAFSESPYLTITRMEVR